MITMIREMKTKETIACAYILRRRLGDIAHRKDVQLLLSCATGRVDGEEDRPRDNASQQADGDEDLEEAHEEVAIDRLVVENICVREILKILYPPKEARARCRRLALLPQMVEVRSWRVHATEVLSGDEESSHKG
jgi:hypothetical protein